MKTLGKIAFILVLIGAINWALIGFFKFDLVAILFGEMTMLSRLIYGLVGISGLYCISFFTKKNLKAHIKPNYSHSLNVWLFFSFYFKLVIIYKFKFFLSFSLIKCY